MPNLRTALEAAIAEDPDDLASVAAYADFLHDQGDVRGEFIQVQLALEGAGLTAEACEGLRARERQLLKKHERDWLGELAPFLLDHDVSDLDGDYYGPHQKYKHRW